MKKLLIINGPNLNLLGLREKEVYGSQTFEDYLTELIAEFGDRAGQDYFQANGGGDQCVVLYAQVGGDRGCDRGGGGLRAENGGGAYLQYHGPRGVPPCVAHRAALRGIGNGVRHAILPARCI